jgi:hypothetical protein
MAAGFTSGVRFKAGGGILPFIATFRSALRPTQLILRWVQRVKQPKAEADLTHLHPVLRFRMQAALLPCPLYVFMAW